MTFAGSHSQFRDKWSDSTMKTNPHLGSLSHIFIAKHGEKLSPTLTHYPDIVSDLTYCLEVYLHGILMHTGIISNIISDILSGWNKPIVHKNKICQHPCLWMNIDMRVG